MRKYGLIISYLILIMQFTNAQDRRPMMQMDKSRIRIGEQIRLKVSIDLPTANANVIWPVFQDTLTSSKVEIVSQSDIQKTNAPQPAEFREYIITSFDSGYHAIPPVFVVVNGDTLLSDPLLLQVETVPVDTTQQFKDIKEIQNEEESWSDWFLGIWYWMLDNWFIVLPFLILIGVLIWILLRKKESNLPPPPPAVPAHIEAFGKLRLLENRQLWQQGQIKEYFTDVSDILRHYIERRFDVPALEQTTDEVLHFLRIMEMNEEARRHLVYVLKLADLVKFAKENPAPFECESALKRAFQFVELTLIQETEKAKEDQP